MSDFETIARQAANSILHNVLNTVTVDIFFNRSPGDDSGGDRAIPSVDFQVRAQGFIIQRGRSGNDGKITMSIRGGSSELEIMYNGAVITKYEVTRTTAPLAAANSITGQKQRLRLLGYQVGHSGPDGNGIDATNNADFERSMLDFQTDESLYNDAIANANTQNQLTTRAGT